MKLFAYLESWEHGDKFFDSLNHVEICQSFECLQFKMQKIWQNSLKFFVRLLRINFKPLMSTNVDCQVRWQRSLKLLTVDCVGFIRPRLHEQSFAVEDVVDEDDVGAEFWVQFVNRKPRVMTIVSKVADDFTTFSWN